MIWANGIILASVLAGTFLALVPRRRDIWMGPIRTFALMAALSVVVLHLLPEALSQAGAGAIFVFVLGLLAPELLSRLGVFLWRAGRDAPTGNERRNLALEAGYFGLLLHKVGDGIGLGAITVQLADTSARKGVMVALAAHAVPVVAIVVLTFDSVRGRGSALRRAAGLAAASIFGVFLTRAVPAEQFTSASAWVSALVSGMLVHVVAHDLTLDLPTKTGARIFDLLAAALGIFVSFLGRGAHQDSAVHDQHQVLHFEHSLAHFAIETGPLLMFGLVVGAILSTLGKELPAGFLRSRGALLDGGRGALMGASRPLFAASVLPRSRALKEGGAAPALIVAFLFAAPELGVETFALTVRFLGWEFAVVRLLAAILLALCASVLVASVAVPAAKGATKPNAPLGATSGEGPWAGRALEAFDSLFHHIGAWMILGVVGAALIEVSLPEKAFSEVDGWFAQFAVISLIAVPSYVCAPAATPLAAVLLAKGLSPGAVLVGLLLGPVTNVATLTFLRRWFGMRAAALGVFAVVLLSWVFGLAMDTMGGDTLASAAPHHEEEHGAAWQVAALFSGLFLLRAVYSKGVRGFLSTLEGDHGHSHDHDGHDDHDGHGGHGGAQAQGGPDEGEQEHAHGSVDHVHVEHGQGDSHRGHSH